MQELRWYHIPGARVKLPETLSALLRSELERAIYEAALSRDSGRENHRKNEEYSRDYAKNDFIAQLEDMLEDAGNSGEREAIRRCLEQLKKS